MLRALIAASLLLVLVAGCGPSVGTVSGKISHKGESLNYGTVSFRASTKQVMSGQIQPDGTYKVEDVPVGKADIAVRVPKTAPAAPKPGSAAPSYADSSPAPTFTGKPVTAPSSYGDLETSGLSYEVTSGQQTYDIDLK